MKWLLLYKALYLPFRDKENALKSLKNQRTDGPTKNWLIESRSTRLKIKLTVVAAAIETRVDVQLGDVAGFDSGWRKGPERWVDAARGIPVALSDGQRVEQATR